MPRFRHKGIRHDKKEPHHHPSHPYDHPSGRHHNYPPSSRIKDRKGKEFRHTAQEHRRKGVKTSYKPRSGKRKRWD